jgi:hypothetical protein
MRTSGSLQQVSTFPGYVNSNHRRAATALPASRHFTTSYQSTCYRSDSHGDNQTTSQYTPADARVTTAAIGVAFLLTILWRSARSQY